MKKIAAFVFFVGILSFSLTAQETATTNTDTTAEQVDSSATAEDVAESVVAPEETKNSVAAVPLHTVIKQKYIEGGVPWMTPVLLILIIGLGLAIERIIYLSFATSNNEKLLADVEAALASGGVEKAKEICRNTRGPVASIFYQGLDRANESIDIIEKSVVSYGGVQMGQLEKGLTWLSLFISLAPMLGFLGTVVGMVAAFDAIEIQGDISPTIVAGGIKVALLTTIFGLIVAIVLQIFYNYIMAKIESIVNSMEDASISLIDILVKFKKK